MFKLNNSTQINLFDNAMYLNDYHMKLLNTGWAGYFRENIFPKIDEERYSVLYSNKVSRPNTPVNIMISLLILKELTGLTDEELMESLIFDIRFQYALYTTSLDRQPISRNMFTNFRNMLISYELETGIDLYKEEIIKLSKEINKCCKKDTSLKRMDSVMISSPCKHLSRIDLVYKVNANLIEAINKIDNTILTERERKYLEPGFKKENVYNITKDNQFEKLSILLNDSKELYKNYKDNDLINKLDEFKLLIRLLEEQLDDNTSTPKDSKKIKPTSLQNPSDPEATYRNKYGNNIGYVGNVVEEIHENGEAYITDYDLKQNVYSDTSFMEDYINNKADDKEETTLVDAAYFSSAIDKKAKKKNINLIPTQTMGKKETKDLIVAEFKIDDDKNEVLSCPNGETPIDSKYNNETHVYLAHFDRNKCLNCPLREKCEKAKFIMKRRTTLRVKKEAYQKAKLEVKMHSKEYKEISNHRAGIEGTMSTLRRRYNIDKSPSTGLLRIKLKFGGDILSINIKKAIKYKNITINNDVDTQNISNIEKVISFFQLTKNILCY